MHYQHITRAPPTRREIERLRSGAPLKITLIDRTERQPSSTRRPQPVQIVSGFTALPPQDATKKLDQITFNSGSFPSKKIGFGEQFVSLFLLFYVSVVYSVNVQNTRLNSQTVRISR